MKLSPIDVGCGFCGAELGEFCFTTASEQKYPGGRKTVPYWHRRRVTYRNTVERKMMVGETIEQIQRDHRQSIREQPKLYMVK